MDKEMNTESCFAAEEILRYIEEELDGIEFEANKPVELD